MICKYCGNEVDDNAQVCPVCNSPLYGDDQNGYVQESLDLGDYSQTGYDQSNYDQGDYAQSGYDSNAGYDHYGYGETNDTFEEDPFAQDEKPAKKGVSVNLPKVQAATVMVCMVNANLKDRANTLEAAVAQVQMSYSSLEERIGSLDSTVANVQQEAYNQLASTSISITKDITSLTGPVSLGKYNMMFIIKAKGNLNLNTSFEWQKYNSTTGGWEEIVFTGKATSNDQYGLRLENLMENGEYKSVLWANGITKAAEGTYRCVISDANGIKKTSSEASVSVADAQ